MKMTITLPEKLSNALQEEAERRLLTVPETLRAILSESFTKPSSPGPMATQPSPAGAQGGARATRDEKLAALLAMSDAEMTERLKEIGYFPKDFTDTYLTAADPCAPDGRWRKHVIVTAGPEREYWQVGHAKDGTEAKMDTHQWESRLRVFSKTDLLLADLKKEKLL